MKTFKVFSSFILLFLLCYSTTKAQEEWNLFSTANDIKSVTQQGVWLWLGTNGGGLVKFHRTSGDMTFFTKENSGIPDMVVNDVKTDGTDNIWAATDNGLAYFNGSTWTVYRTTNSDIPSDKVNSITIDGNGDKWVATDAGIAELSGNTWTTYNTGNSDIPSDNAVMIRMKPTGSKWICTDNGLARFDEAVWTVYNTGNSDIPSNNVLSVNFDELGLGMIVGTDAGVAFLTGVNWSVYDTGNSNLPDDNVTSIAFDTQGGIWVSTYNGIAKFSNLDWLPYNSSNGEISNDKVNALVIDVDDNKWLGTVDSLNRFKDTVWTKYFINTTLLESNQIYDIKTDANGWSWFATSEGLASYNGAVWTYYEMTRPYTCMNLSFDNTGMLWVATDNGAAMFSNGTLNFYNMGNSPMPSDFVTFIEFDVFNNMWVGTDNGLAKYNGQNWTVWNTGNSNLPDDYITYLIFEGNTKCWIGTQNGLAMFNSIDWTVWNTGNSDLPFDYISSIQVDANSNKWIGTMGGGISFFPDTAFFNFDTGNSDLLSDNISALSIDLNGNLWLGTSDMGLIQKVDTIWTNWNLNNSPLPFPYIHSLFTDLGNNLWTATMSGGAVFNKDGITPSIHITYTDASVCAGNDFKVVFRNLFAFNPGNFFTVELSDADGSFANPIVIGTKTSISLSGRDSIICRIPEHLQSGNGFRVRILSSNPAVMSKDNGTDIMIRELPNPQISGRDVVCFSSTHMYSAPWQHNVTFKWFAQNGTIIGSDSTNVVQIHWSDTMRTGRVILVQSNELGCKDSAIVNVEILGHPRMFIVGPKKVCAGLEYIYTADTSRNTRYWSAIGGRVISMPAFNKVKVIWTAQEYGRLKLVEVTAGGCEDSTFYEVTIQPTPTADISGDQEVREGEIHEYITEATSSDITKKWYAVNGEIIGDDDADTLRVKWPKGGLGAVIQTQKTEAECADSNIITVRIFEEIGISGTRNVCQDATELYEANKNLGAYAEWTVVGGEIQGSSNGRTCLVKWGTPGIGILRLIQWIPNTTYRDTIDINVNINGKPAKPSITENQDTLISSADAGNQWYWNGQLIPGATSKKYYTYQVKGNYTVQVTVAHKCISLMSDMYSFTSDIEDNTELDVIKVFPNPSAGEYQIIINNLVGEFEYRVVNLLGLEIAEGRGVAGNETLKVNLEGEAAGIYHLIITINGRQYLEKLILTR